MSDEVPHEEANPHAATPSRRSFLGFGAGTVAAAALLPSRAQAQRRRADLTAVTDRLGQRAEWRSPELRLARRITMGMTKADADRARSLGYARYLEEQLNPGAIDDTACTDRIATYYPEFHYSQATLLAKDAIFWSDIAGPVQRAVIERAIFSRRQLEQRMLEFWADHFNIAIQPTRVVDYRDVLMAHALGKFGDLVRASMRSPAMLIYLDQVWSTKWGVNENYARELMELHTVGWDGGYSQSDVHDLARVLTGFTVDGQRNFTYNASYHDFGAKTVMGQYFPARPQAGGTAGMDEALNFAEFLIHHPNTARTIVTKLLKWFVRPDPTDAQISAAAATFTSTDGDIKAVLRTVLSLDNIQGAPAKLKRPFHYYVSVVRATEATLDPWTDRANWDAVTGHLWDNAHAPMTWQTPDGFPDRAEYWAGLMVNRWNAVSSILYNWGSPGRYPRFSASAFSPNPSVAVVIEDINQKMCGGEMSYTLRTELQRFLGSLPFATPTQIQQAVHLAACAPEFQYY
jgi:uncharacterized protein (DUF1800 family)